MNKKDLNYIKEKKYKIIYYKKIMKKVWRKFRNKIMNKWLKNNNKIRFFKLLSVN